MYTKYLFYKYDYVHNVFIFREEWKNQRFHLLSLTAVSLTSYTIIFMDHVFKCEFLILCLAIIIIEDDLLS